MTNISNNLLLLVTNVPFLPFISRMKNSLMATFVFESKFKARYVIPNEPCPSTFIILYLLLNKIVFKGKFMISILYRRSCIFYAEKELYKVFSQDNNHNLHEDIYILVLIFLQLSLGLQYLYPFLGKI